MKLLCKMIGGSRAYGLQTPESDFDTRGVYLHSDPAKIIGLKVNEDSSLQKDKDNILYELRHFFNLLRRTNTMALELLYNSEWLEISEDWKIIEKNAIYLIDSDYFYKSLKSYMANEIRLAFGERTGQLGGSRKEALDKWGFSPKNVVHLLRLAYAGDFFFQRGHFPVNVHKWIPEHAKLMLQIKLHPDQFKGKIDSLRAQIDIAMTSLDWSYNNRQINYSFDETLANDICINLYRKMI